MSSFSFLGSPHHRQASTPSAGLQVRVNLAVVSTAQQMCIVVGELAVLTGWVGRDGLCCRLVFTPRRHHGSRHHRHHPPTSRWHTACRTRHSTAPVHDGRRTHCIWPDATRFALTCRCCMGRRVTARRRACREVSGGGNALLLLFFIFLLTSFHFFFSIFLFLFSPYFLLPGWSCRCWWVSAGGAGPWCVRSSARTGLSL